MNDPHVVALIYKLEHSQAVDYREAKPIDHEEPDFHVKIANEKVRFEFKKHHATAKAAHKAIEEYICAWEVDVGLWQGGPNYFKLKFAHAQIEDRNPTLGVKDISVTVRAGTPTATVSATVDKEYPSPPSGLTITPDVRTLYDRYMGCRQGKEPLPSMAYFCLTVIERSPTKKEFSSRVRDTIRHLSSGKGGRQARKAAGKDKDLTAQDRRFLDEAIKALIRRTAERAHDPDGDLPLISMSDLPAPTKTHR